MSPLRLRMIDDMVLASLSPGTQENYIRSVRQLAEHYGQSPAKLAEEQVRQYFLYLVLKKEFAKNTLKVKIAGIRFFYERTLGWNWRVLKTAKARGGRRLPDVLTQEQVRVFLNRVRDPKKRMCLVMIYSCGLRVSEATRLIVQDIDSTRMLVRVHGKGSKQRFVPLPKPVLHQLRNYWKIDKPKTLFFPGKDPTRPMSNDVVQRCCRVVARECGIQKKVTPHCFRHSYATHLLEDGVSIRVIQEILGHSSCRTTQIYTHISPKILGDLQTHVDHLVKDL